MQEVFTLPMGVDMEIIEMQSDIELKARARDQDFWSLNTTAVSYIPKRGRNVLLLSSKHRDPAVTEEEKRKPVIIADYNHCKGAVDNLDK
ncbi:hypothetical protein JOQ06_027582, partial [Pogonophryne albipinna]